MWTLKKPDLERAMSDIKAVIKASNGALLDSDEPHIRMVYQAYDNNNGTISKAVNDHLCQKQRNALKKMYSATYNTKPSQMPLYFIRKELMDAVQECPMCGMASPSQLDHQLPKSSFEALSVCRLNLVPTCGVCNNKKRARSAKGFIHPYYAKFPNGVIFLIAKVDVDMKELAVSWHFEIDGSNIGDSVLLDKINNQVSVIELFDRLSKASNTYLSDLLYGVHLDTEAEIRYFFKIEYEKNEKLYGLNHWRTALVSALYNCKNFSPQVLQRFVSQIKPVNGGCNA